MGRQHASTDQMNPDGVAALLADPAVAGASPDDVAREAVLRVREGNVYHRIVRVLENAGVPLRDLFEAAVAVLPEAWDGPAPLAFCIRTPGLCVPAGAFPAEGPIDQWPLHEDEPDQGSLECFLQAGEDPCVWLPEDRRHFLRQIALALGSGLARANRWADLNERARHAERAVDALDAIVVVLDETGRIERVSPGCETAVGHTQEESRGQYFWDLMVPAEERERVRESILGAPAAQAAQSQDSCWLCREGGRCRISWLVVRDTPPSEGTASILVVGTDRSEFHDQCSLREQHEQLLQLAIEVSGGGIWSMTFTTAGPITDLPDHMVLSPQLRDLLGYDETELPNSLAAWRGLMHPDDRPRVEALTREHLRGAIPRFEAEYRLRHKDGSLRWLLSRGELQWDACSRLARYAGMVWDITERKMAGEILAESERRYRAVSECTYDWESWVDQHGRLVWVNAAVERITGYTVEECLRSPSFPAALVDEADRGIVQSIFYNVHEQGGHSDAEFRFRRKNGLSRWGSASWQAIHDGDGVFMGRRISIREITSRKRIEKRRREVERRYRALLDSAHLAAVELNREGRIVFANPFLLKLTGYEQRDVVGQDWFTMFLAPEERPEVGIVFQDVLRRGLHPYYESDIITRTGGRCSIAWNNIVLTSQEGEPYGSLSVGMDVSLQKRAVNELAGRNEELELLNGLTIGRELRMIELKREVNSLLQQQGLPPRYEISEGK